MHLLSSPKMAFGGLTIPMLGQWDTEEDDCHRVFNRTTQRYPATFIPVVGVPVIVLLCTIGNGFNLCILSKHYHGGAKQVLLLSLAVTDILAM
jgi:hypothetical protein